MYFFHGDFARLKLFLKFLNILAGTCPEGFRGFYKRTFLRISWIIVESTTVKLNVSFNKMQTLKNSF